MPSHYAGFLRQPKWGHLRDLHKAIKHCEEYMISSDPTQVQLGVNLEVVNIFQDSSLIFLDFDNSVFTILFPCSYFLLHSDLCYSYCVRRMSTINIPISVQPFLLIMEVGQMQMSHSTDMFTSFQLGL